MSLDINEIKKRGMKVELYTEVRERCYAIHRTIDEIPVNTFKNLKSSVSIIERLVEEGG
jgi:hypothetical protein